MGDIPVAALADFEALHPDVHIVETTQLAEHPYNLAQLVAGGAPMFFHVADLSEAARTINFRGDDYLPGTTTCWTVDGHTLAIPFTQMPWGLAWRPDAFGTAGISPPSAEWTLQDFERACTVLQGLAGTGRVKGLRHALGPLMPDGHGGQLTGALLWSGLWQAFVWGFGGTIAANGRFALTDPKTIQAVEVLADLARRFAVPAQDIPPWPPTAPYDAWEEGNFSLFAMQFLPYTGQSLPKPYLWARLPRFPVSPVIPVVSSAIALQPSGLHEPPASPTSPQALVAAQVGAWLNTPAGIRGTAAGLPPVIADPSVQDAFWSGGSAGAATAIGDWANFRGAYDGFPAIPTKPYVVAAIGAAVAGTSTVSAALATAERQLNATLSP